MPFKQNTYYGPLNIQKSLRTEPTGNSVFLVYKNVGLLIFEVRTHVYTEPLCCIVRVVLQMGVFFALVRLEGFKISIEGSAGESFDLKSKFTQNLLSKPTFTTSSSKLQYLELFPRDQFRPADLTFRIPPIVPLHNQA